VDDDDCMAAAAVSSSLVNGDETKREVLLLLLELVVRNDDDDDEGEGCFTKAAWVWKDSAPEVSARATTTWSVSSNVGVMVELY
jgi:hypothetical protein